MGGGGGGGGGGVKSAVARPIYENNSHTIEHSWLRRRFCLFDLILYVPSTIFQ